MTIKKSTKSTNSIVNSSTNASNSNYDECIKHIEAAIQELCKFAPTDSIALDALGDLSVVLLSLK